MKKIILLPLDERPCNYHFGEYMLGGTPYEVLLPPKEYMGDKKKAGNIEKLISWLKKNAKNSDGIVVSLDTLLYGGIVPSRLHYDSEATLVKRINVLKEIKEQNPNLLIYGFQLLMRNPEYSSSEEEPDYYEEFGREIHLYGVYKHKTSLGIITTEEKREFSKIEKILPKEYLNDYITRRSINSLMNKHFLKLVEDKVLDFAIIPQDDSSPYGFTALDQIETRQMIEDKNLELDVYMYPGADEVANVLLSRMVLHYENKKPLVYLKYSSVGDGKIIPLYEDRYLAETLKYQILAAGGLIIDDLKNADIVLLVNTPPEKMREAASYLTRTIEYDSFRTLVEFVEFANYTINDLNKTTVIADVAYANGGDYHLFKLLKQKGLLFKVNAYAGWNTSSNTIGTALPQGIFDYLFPNRKENLDFLSLRYVEDIGYCSIVRKEISSKLVLPNHYFLIDGKKGPVVNEIKDELNKFIKNNFNNEKFVPTINKIYSPWNRMFEIGLEISANENKK